MEHTRAKVFISDLRAMNEFINMLQKHGDDFYVEDFNVRIRASAKSSLGMLYMVSEHNDDMYLVNETHDGVFPSGVDKFRPV